MMSPVRIVFISALTGLFLTVSTVVYAVSTVSLFSAADGIFEIRSVFLEGASALDIIVTYDTAVFNGPRVAPGVLLSGAITAVNSGTPGMVRIGAIRTAPVSGAGTLFTLVFERIGEGEGIRGMTARLSDGSGKPLSVQVQIAIASPSLSAAAETQSRQTAAPGPSGGAAPQPKGPGTVVGPVVPQATDVSGEAGSRDLNQQQEVAVPATGAISPGKGEEAKGLAPLTGSPRRLYTQQSVLERFRQYRGERTPRELSGLFERDPLIGFQQEPAIALSDGVTPVTVRFITTPVWARTKELACMRARLLTLERDPDATNTWIAVLLPEKGTDSASLSVLQNDVLMVYQITVAPKIDLPKSATEADFRVYLNKQTASPRKASPPGGETATWREDYIFTANYLAARRTEKQAKDSAVSARERHLRPE
jgi:hypothetical protein